MGSYSEFKGLGGMIGGYRIVVQCDNEAVVSVLSHGRSWNLFLQAGMCEVAYQLAVNKCELRVVHILSAKNQIADWLLRWTDSEARQKFHCFAREKSLRRASIP